jgi:translation elongation factor EF-1beta
MSRVIVMRLRVEPDDNDTRSAEQIAEDISMKLMDEEYLPGSGIAIATVVQEAILG